MKSLSQIYQIQNNSVIFDSYNKDEKFNTPEYSLESQSRQMEEISKDKSVLIKEISPLSAIQSENASNDNYILNFSKTKRKTFSKYSKWSSNVDVSDQKQKVTVVDLNQLVFRNIKRHLFEETTLRMNWRKQHPYRPFPGMEKVKSIGKNFVIFQDSECFPNSELQEENTPLEIKNDKKRSLKDFLEEISNEDN